MRHMNFKLTSMCPPFVFLYILEPLATFAPSAVIVYASLFSFENGTSFPVDYGSDRECTWCIKFTFFSKRY